MDITETTQNSVTVLSLSGRLDGASSPGLEQKIDALAAAGTTQVVFDCAALAYASSAGLRVFLSAAKKLKANGGGAAFAALSPAVTEVFELSGFNQVLSVHPGVAQAVGALT